MKGPELQVNISVDRRDIYFSVKIDEILYEINIRSFEAFKQYESETVWECYCNSKIYRKISTCN